MTIKNKIVPNLWFDDNAEEAANFYTSLFKNSKIQRIIKYGKEGYEIHKRPEGSIMTVEFELAGYKFIGLNGGPLFDFTPSISFFVVCETEEETRKLWERLLKSGSELMPLQKYEWSELYGWVKDRFGVTWQISKGSKTKTGGQSITPSIMFSKVQQGKAREALSFYISVFKDSRVEGVLEYDKQSETRGQVMHAQFQLLGQTYMAMDSGVKQSFTFNEAISLMIYCTTQEEVDYYWEKLTQGGDPKSQQCGWLKDKFGLSWQVNLKQLDDMLADPNPEKAARVMNAMLKMKKLDLEKLQKAYSD